MSDGSERTYRADVDGLRGLAVLLVLLYHLRVPGLAGGFVGVDVFFVISGFVVTRLITREKTAGTFSFKRFYLRRFWRLQPALYLTIAVTLCAGHVLLAPEDLYRLAWSAASALVLSANFYFLKSTSGYATQLAENEPLLHMWSLAVEEQFYLLWPTLMLAGARLRALRQPWLITVLLAGLLGLSEWLARTTPAAAYYLLSARLVELGLGAVLVRTEGLRMPRGLAHALAGLGLAAVVGASALLHPRNTFPGLLAMVPCAGAALLIQVGPSSSFVTRLLQTRPAVWLGRISYSFYLWHWPAVAFVNYRGIEMSAPLRLALGVGALLASLASYRFWEAPTRAASSRPARQLAVGLAICLVVGIVSIVRPGSRAEVEARAAQSIMDEEGHHATCECLFAARTWADVDACSEMLRGGLPEVVARPGARRMLVWGDSHGFQWGPALQSRADQLGIVPTVLAAAGCPPLFGIHRTDKTWQGRACSEEFGANVQRFVRRFHFDVILVVGRFGVYEHGWRNRGQLVKGREHFIADAMTTHVDEAHSREAVHRNLRTTLRSLTSLRDTKVIFVLPTPELPHAMTGADDSEVLVSRSDYLAARGAVTRIARATPGLRILDAVDALCDQRACHGVGPEGRLYIDDNHLSAQGISRVLPLVPPLLAP